jgi:phage baseplate assembly protein gpV
MWRSAGFAAALTAGAVALLAGGLAPGSSARPAPACGQAGGPPPGDDQAPVAAFSMSPEPAVVGVAVSFDASASHDPDSAISDYCWSFGDGTTAAGETQSHTYSSPGTQTVTLLVADEFGLTASTEHKLQVGAVSTDRLRISLTPSRARVQRNGRVRFTGTVRPAHPGARVRLQRRVAGGRFATVARPLLRGAGARSRFSASTTVRRTADYRASVAIGGQTATTKRRTIRVTG